MQLLTTTFLFMIIHEDSTSENRGNGSFSIISQEALSEGNLENKRMILTLSGADVCARSVGIDPNTYWGLLRQWNLTSVISGSDGGSLWRLLCSLVPPKTQHLKSFFGVDIVYLQQLHQVIHNGGGGPQLLTQGCVYACVYTNGQDFPLSDVNRGRIWNSSFWETVYDFF